MAPWLRGAMAEGSWMEEPGSTTMAARTPASLGALVYWMGMLRETFLTSYPNYHFLFTRGEHPTMGVFLLGCSWVTARMDPESQGPSQQKCLGASEHPRGALSGINQVQIFFFFNGCEYCCVHSERIFKSHVLANAPIAHQQELVVQRTGFLENQGLLHFHTDASSNPAGGIVKKVIFFLLNDWVLVF